MLISGCIKIHAQVQPAGLSSTVMQHTAYSSSLVGSHVLLKWVALVESNGVVVVYVLLTCVIMHRLLVQFRADVIFFPSSIHHSGWIEDLINTCYRCFNAYTRLLSPTKPVFENLFQIWVKMMSA